MHEASLERTMGRRSAGGRDAAGRTPRGEYRPFEEAIDCFRELGLGCNVEIGPCEGREGETARVAVETLRRCWPAGLPAPLLSSFKDAALLAASRPRRNLRGRC